MTAKKHKRAIPSHYPQIVVPDRAWYYETRRGVELITQKRDPLNRFVSADITLIPWTKLMRSAARCGWKVSRIKREADNDK